MKKIITLTLALTLFFSGFAQQYNLGKVSFATDSVWIISGNGITQIWSDAVQTDSCRNKTLYNTVNYNVDCCSNPNQKGDLFSWEAINQFGDKLCPAPWRVPTTQDFIDLDIALGGTGKYQGQGNSIHRDKYLNTWGGSYGGYCDHDGYIVLQGKFATYWSQSQSKSGSTQAYRLYFDVYGTTSPQSDGRKYYGKPLRCIRCNIEQISE